MYRISSHLSTDRPGSALVAAIALVATLACAGERPPGERLPVREAVKEAREELPGTVLTRRHRVLDGELRATVAAPDSATAEAALSAGFVAADSVALLLGLHRGDSEVAKINAAAGRAPVRVTPWTEAVVAASLEWAERTGGAFDPTIGPLLDVWGFGTGRGVAPDSARVARAREKVGWRRVRHDPAAHTVFLTETGMQFDLRAAARGFALDRVVEEMESAGATSGILDLNGDQRFFGPGTETRRDLWPLAVSNPYDPGRAFARLELPPGGLSTTSPYARVVEISDQRVGHILDPRTGFPARGVASVTIYAPEALLSDILSTALVVLGRARGCEMAARWPDVEALIVFESPQGKRADTCMTPGMKQYVKDLVAPTPPKTRDDE